MSVPTAPSALVLTVVSETAIKLDWTASKYQKQYFIYRSLDGTTYAYIGWTNSATITYTNTGLTKGTLYYYKVRAHNTEGFSDYCTAVSATTAGAVALAAPTSVTSVPISGTTVEINFTNASVGEDFHCIERKGATYAEITQLATGTTYYLDTGLTEGTTYTYKIRDLSGASTYGDYSSEVTATPPKPFIQIAYGTGTTAEGVALTALTTEVARAAADVTIESTYTPNDTVRFSHEFAAPTATKIISEVGVFDTATTGGTMLGRKLLATTVTVTDGQYFMIKYDFVVKDGGCGT